jgi:hypothetical protein
MWMSLTRFSNVLENESGQSMAAYRVPESEVTRRLVNRNTMTGENFYGASRECERAFLMMKIDAVLTFFALEAQDQQIGFRA